MNFVKLVFYFLISTFIISCNSKQEELEENGYQVFNRFNFALKCPCELEIDSADVKNNTGNYNDYTSYKCIEITKKSTISIYHLQFLKDTVETTKADINRAIIDIQKLYRSEGRPVKHRLITGMRSLYYEFNPMVSGTQLFNENFTCFVIVESENSKNEIEELLNTIKLY